MKRRAIVTLAIGRQWHSIPEVHKPMKAYADYCKADFLKITHCLISKVHVYYEKYQIYDLLSTYDTILYLDGDVLVTPRAFDSIPIFDHPVYGKSRDICLVDERANNDFQTREHIREMWSVIKKDIPANWDGCNYNAGVMMIPRAARHVLKVPPLHWMTKEWTQDQVTLNAQIAHRGWRVTRMSREWNEMPFANDIPQMRDAKFAHYGGWAGYNPDMEFLLGMVKAWPYLPLTAGVRGGVSKQMMWSVPQSRRGHA